MTTFSSMDSLPMFSFTNPGDIVDLTIDEDPREVETKYGQRVVLSGVSGTDSTADVVAEETRRKPEPGERCTVFVRSSGAQGGALATALRAAGLTAHTDSFAPGTRLRLKFTEEVPSGKGNPTKLYAAKIDPAPSAVLGAAAVDEWA